MRITSFDGNCPICGLALQQISYLPATFFCPTGHYKASLTLGYSSSTSAFGPAFANSSGLPIEVPQAFYDAFRDEELEP